MTAPRTAGMPAHSAGRSPGPVQQQGFWPGRFGVGRGQLSHAPGTAARKSHSAAAAPMLPGPFGAQPLLGALNRCSGTPSPGRTPPQRPRPGRGFAPAGRGPHGRPPTVRPRAGPHRRKNSKGAMESAPPETAAMTLSPGCTSPCRFNCSAPPLPRRQWVQLFPWLKSRFMKRVCAVPSQLDRTGLAVTVFGHNALRRALIGLLLFRAVLMAVVVGLPVQKNSTTSASCSMEPESRRSLSWGRWSLRPVAFPPNGSAGSAR